MNKNQFLVMVCLLNMSVFGCLNGASSSSSSSAAVTLRHRGNVLDEDEPVANLVLMLKSKQSDLQRKVLTYITERTFRDFEIGMLADAIQTTFSSSLGWDCAGDIDEYDVLTRAKIYHYINSWNIL